ncbi:hypothetical protein ERN12_09140 [Rhodobacteraceae bacterium]|nr:hypothetical protein ERN12_09140 [Paracoccaceae bacterium]
MRMRLAYILGASLSMAACTASMDSPVTPDGSPGQISPAACGADTVQGKLGASYANLPASTWPTPNRVEKPGSMLTMDYRPDRLRIQLDAHGKIVALRCG